MTKPSECPIKIPASNYPVNFAEAGSFDPGTLGSFRLTFYDANDQFVTASYNVQIYTLGGTLTPQRDTIHVSGTYQAGVAGFGGSQTDRGINDLEISGSRRLATAVLTYQKIASASIAAPGIVNPDFDFVVDADLHVANAVPPLTWAWYHNGSFAGSTEQLGWNSGSGGSTHDFEVRITEADGTEWTATKTVTTRTCEIECTQ